MKRILLTILILLFAGNAYSAGTCVPSGTDFTSGSVVRVTLTCTADAADAAGTAWSYTFSSDLMDDLDGTYMYRVVANPGATGPTDASDLAITDAVGLTPIAADSKGLNFIDNTTNTSVISEDEDGSNWYYPISEENALTLTITNNSVNSAVTVITIFTDRLGGSMF